MEPEKKSNGALVGLIIVIILLIIGGIYMWQLKESANLEQEQAKAKLRNTVTTEDSSELESLEADLGSLDTDLNVDTEGVQ